MNIIIYGKISLVVRGSGTEIYRSIDNAGFIISNPLKNICIFIINKMGCDPENKPIDYRIR